MGSVNRLRKGPDGRLKRIEYRGRHLRASRTGGVALRAQTKAAGINLTANTARGMRVSTRLAKGTQVAFQNGRFILRGRYGDGPTKLNLSKSGVSVSSKTELGTINWFKPGYSSIKLGGVQLRGKKAVYLHLIVGLLQLAAYLILFLMQACVLLVQGLWWVAIRSRDGWRRLIERRNLKKLEPIEQSWMRELEPLNAESLATAMDLIFFTLAVGEALTPEAPEAKMQPRPIDSSRAEASALLFRLLEGCPLTPPRDLELLFGCLAKAHAEKTGESAVIEKFLELDDQAGNRDRRTRLQDRLLGAYVESCGIEAE